MTTTPKLPPYARGSSDYWAAVPDMDNPYPTGSPSAEDWHRGWMEACDDDAADGWIDDDDF